MAVRFLPLTLVLCISLLFTACGGGPGKGAGGASVTPIEPVAGASYSTQVWMDTSAEGGGTVSSSASHEVSKPSIGGGAARSTGSSSSFTVQGGVYGAF